VRIKTTFHYISRIKLTTTFMLERLPDGHYSRYCSIVDI